MMATFWSRRKYTAPERSGQGFSSRLSVHLIMVRNKKPKYSKRYKNQINMV